MADYTTVTVAINTQTTDAGAPTMTGTVIAFGGTAGANEFRWQRTGGGGGAATGSAAWPNIIKPGATAFVEECWAFTADTTGVQAKGYPTAPGTQWSRAFAYSFDALGSPASAMQMSAFQDSVPTTPTAGTQTANAVTGSNIVNGQATDSTSTSYFKMNAYGSGFPAAGAQETPAAASLSSTPAVTNGSAGSVSPAAAAWLATWQSAQGWLQFITAPSVAKVTTAFLWYFNCALFVGPNMQTGIMVWAPFVLQYTWT
jgi:hypothetical protein